MTKPSLPPPPLKANPRVAKETEAYAYYRQYCLDHGLTALLLTFAQWRQLTRAANRRLAALLIEEGKTVHLPQRLGNVSVLRKKMNFKRKKIDFHQTKLQGKTVYHINEHSDFYDSFIHWEKITCNFRNKGFFSLKPVRDVSRGMAHVMQQPGGYRRYALKPEPTVFSSFR